MFFRKMYWLLFIVVTIYFSKLNGKVIPEKENDAVLDREKRDSRPCMEGNTFEKPCYHCFCGNQQWVCIKTCREYEVNSNGSSCAIGDAKQEGCNDCFCGFGGTWECAPMNTPDCGPQPDPECSKQTIRKRASQFTSFESPNSVKTPRFRTGFIPDVLSNLQPSSEVAKDMFTGVEIGFRDIPGLLRLKTLLVKLPGVNINNLSSQGLMEEITNKLMSLDLTTKPGRAFLIDIFRKLPDLLLRKNPGLDFIKNKLQGLPRLNDLVPGLDLTKKIGIDFVLDLVKKVLGVDLILDIRVMPGLDLVKDLFGKLPAIVIKRIPGLDVLIRILKEFPNLGRDELPGLDDLVAILRELSVPELKQLLRVDLGRVPGLDLKMVPVVELLLEGIKMVTKFIIT